VKVARSSKEIRAFYLGDRKETFAGNKNSSEKGTFASNRTQGKKVPFLKKFPFKGGGGK